MDVKPALLDRARALGFALCRVARCEPPPHAAEFGQWLDAGMAGRNVALARTRQGQARRPAEVLPGARSVIVLAMNYWQGPRTARAGAPARPDASPATPGATITTT